jgi:uncharacterized protein YbjT (DUF2867 family)
MMQTKNNVIVTGATGMVGEGVLSECLSHAAIQSVLVVNRRPCGYTHPKLKEVIHTDFLDLSAIEDQLKGYNACFFCLGISSVGVSKEVYYEMTYSLTLHFAKTLSKLNKEMTFCYVSGAGTNSTEVGGINWARVKGNTENDLMKLPFAQVFSFRPGIIKPTKGLKYAHKAYHLFTWLFPILKAINQNSFVTLAEIGRAMINTLPLNDERKVLEVKDIKKLANQHLG